MYGFVLFCCLVVEGGGEAVSKAALCEWSLARVSIYKRKKEKKIICRNLFVLAIPHLTNEYSVQLDVCASSFLADYGIAPQVIE